MNKRKQNGKQRNEKVYADFKKLYYNEVQIPAIYRRLAHKYNVAPDTIARLVSKERKKAREADRIL